MYARARGQESLDRAPRRAYPATFCEATLPLQSTRLVNRQFAYKGLQEMLNLRPGDFGGYRFFMTGEERRKPLRELREVLLKRATP